MRGTFAVIAIVLLVVLAAHVQREANQREDEDPSFPMAMAYQSSAGCPSACASSDDATALTTDDAATLATADASPGDH